jgi:hypothetical protein
MTFGSWIAMDWGTQENSAMSLITEVAAWTLGLPEPIGLLLVGALLLAVSSRLQRLHGAAPAYRVPALSKRRIDGRTARRSTAPV